MGKYSVWERRSNQEKSALISSDMEELVLAAKSWPIMPSSLVVWGLEALFLNGLLLLLQFFSVHYLLILDRTNWKTNILTSLLIPYIFFSLPSLIFSLLRGDIGKWIAFVAIVLRLFFPKHFPDWLELPAALILLIVVAPSLIASTIRNMWIGVAICLAIACYLLQEHIRAAGGFRNAFTKANGISNTIGLVILFVYPVWALVIDIL
ncbi:hypothetical protein JRO89_XS02G0054300 [Xanthoceras sorbifolium]|uniref:Uncharacterized protein n=1 Tax=Xanthoceras sorbifolium TaxID=99658 RepID=A0ABQ8IFB6_9ROSI|nr:hypothetical protein JRO89_XS02G0054300 [Xanthoceras sorbifolium]